MAAAAHEAIPPVKGDNLHSAWRNPAAINAPVPHWMKADDKVTVQYGDHNIDLHFPDSAVSQRPFRFGADAARNIPHVDIKPTTVLRGTPKAPDNSALWAFALPFGLSAFGATAAALLNPRDRWGAAKKGALLGVAGLSACGPNAAETAPAQIMLTERLANTPKSSVEGYIHNVITLPATAKDGSTYTLTQTGNPSCLLNGDKVVTFSLKELNKPVDYSTQIAMCNSVFSDNVGGRHSVPFLAVEKDYKLKLYGLTYDYSSQGQDFFKMWSTVDHKEQGELFMQEKTSNGTYLLALYNPATNVARQFALNSEQPTGQISPTTVPGNTYEVMYKSIDTTDANPIISFTSTPEGFGQNGVTPTATQSPEATKTPMITPTPSEVPSTPTETPIPEPKEGDTVHTEKGDFIYKVVTDAEGKEVYRGLFTKLTPSNTTLIKGKVSFNLYVAADAEGSDKIKSIQIIHPQDITQSLYERLMLGKLQEKIVGGKKVLQGEDLKKYNDGLKDVLSNTSSIDYTTDNGSYQFGPSDTVGFDIFLLPNTPEVIDSYIFYRAKDQTNNHYFLSANLGNEKNQNVKGITISETPLSELSDEQWRNIVLMHFFNLMVKNDQSKVGFLPDLSTISKQAQLITIDRIP